MKPNSKCCNPKTKIEQVMHEYKQGNLHSGKSKHVVDNRKQAIAIALAESRKCICE